MVECGYFTYSVLQGQLRLALVEGSWARIAIFI